MYHNFNVILQNTRKTNARLALNGVAKEAKIVWLIKGNIIHVRRKNITQVPRFAKKYIVMSPVNASDGNEGYSDAPDLSDVAANVSRLFSRIPTVKFVGKIKQTG